MAIYMSITLEGGGMDANSCVILSPGYLILEAGIGQNAFSAQIAVIQLFCDCQIKTKQQIHFHPVLYTELSAVELKFKSYDFHLAPVLTERVVLNNHLNTDLTWFISIILLGLATPEFGS